MRRFLLIPAGERQRWNCAAWRHLRVVLTGLLALAGACGDGDDSPDALSGEFLALTYNVAGLPEGISGSHPELLTDPEELVHLDWSKEWRP